MAVRSLSPKTLNITDNYKFNFFNTAFLFLLFAELLISSSAIAQNKIPISDHLPPPPPVSPGTQIIKGNRITIGRRYDILPPADMEPPTSHIGREYIFSSPDKPQAKPTINNVTAYRVEVLGSSDRLLKQVRTIEPKAFFKGNVIQVGIFSQQDNAANLARQLALQGLWARIVNN